MSPLVDVLPEQEIQQLQLTAKFFRGLGDPTRLKILDLLLERERHVTELVDLLQVPQGRV
ncbi:MAG: ArsR family transcriptional regulator, partial [candidate division NC10 bacterium]